MSDRAVFLDKDGTLIEDVPYNVRPEQIRLMPGAGGALQALSGAGYRLFVISNQPGVALGYFPESVLEGVAAELRRQFAGYGVALAGFYYCPHHPAGRVAEYRQHCLCRKPGPGMLRRAAAEQDIDLASSWLIGDILDDIEAGRRAGCRTLLLDNGHETEWRRGPGRLPHFVVQDLPAAATCILAEPDCAVPLQTLPLCTH